MVMVMVMMMIIIIIINQWSFFYFKIEIDSKITNCNSVQWRDFLFLQNATQYVNKYSKSLTHMIEEISLLFVMNKFNKERNFGLDMMWTEWLLYRIMCAVEVCRMCDRVPLDEFVCACVVALVRWNYSTRYVAVPWTNNCILSNDVIFIFSLALTAVTCSELTARKWDFL